MRTTRDFKCGDGEIVRVVYDESGRELLKTTLSASGVVQEWIEYRYARSSPLVEWKWFDARGILISSFSGERHQGDITGIKQSNDVGWIVPEEETSAQSGKE